MILIDQVYKKVHKIKKDKTVDYGYGLKIGKSSLPIGEIATFYRTLAQSLGSLHQAVISKASLHFLSKDR